MAKVGRRVVAAAFLSLAIVPTAHAQFNLPLPSATAPDDVFRDDMQQLFVNRLVTNQPDWEPRLVAMRVKVSAALAPGAMAAATAFADTAKAFCKDEGFVDAAAKKCQEALTPDAMLSRFGKDATALRDAPGRSYIGPGAPFYNKPRPLIARYLRNSGGKEAFELIPQFSANIGGEEAYLVNSVVRGLIGRVLFSIDQALVVAKSDEAEPAKRKSIESNKANALRAVNNGGTLVARATLPMYVASSGTASQAAGLTLSAGMLGPLAEEKNPDGTDSRNASASGAMEYLASFPVRKLDGSSAVLADFILGARGGYTVSGGPIVSGNGSKTVGFGQLMVGLRQGTVMSVSALVTFASNGMNDLVPRLGLNFGASR